MILQECGLTLLSSRSFQLCIQAHASILFTPGCVLVAVQAGWAMRPCFTPGCVYTFCPSIAPELVVCVLVLTASGHRLCQQTRRGVPMMVYTVTVQSCMVPSGEQACVLAAPSSQGWVSGWVYTV
jgi:hypothetical protein